MSEDLIPNIMIFVAVVASIYLVIHLGVIVIGIGSAGTKHCEKPKTRIEYIFPGFEFGCWLGGTP